MSSSGSIGKVTTIKTENEGVKAEEEEEEADVSLARWFIGSNRFSFPFAVLACASDISVAEGHFARTNDNG